LRDTGLTLDPGGFISVDSHLRAVGHTDVFAAGDVASFMPRALPKSGVYAVRAGPVLADNIRRLLTGSELRPFRPQADAMYIVSTGDAYAVGTKWGIAFAGAGVWRLKDWIDRRFMDRFNALPEMDTAVHGPASKLADKAALQEISAIAMRCGGCGAKVGSTVLTRALGTLRPFERDDVLVGLDAPDDAAVVDTGGRRLSVHTVDYFRSIVDDPYIFGKIAANHALGDIFAMGAEPQSALAIATVPYGLESKVEADLSAMMAGANEILAEVGCALVGGHTSEGAELSLGFAVNGLVERDRFLRKGGMQPGDALVLTKPIGTGTLLAADMRGKAKGRWVMKALAHMTQSNRRAAEVLSLHGVHAATDVTGFGLLGHLVEMTKASGVDAEIDLDAIPVLEGARETVASGVFSSLQPQNVRLRRAIRDLEVAALSAGFPLLFDPQTAGGLLASLPEANAAACVSALREAGYVEASIIGRIHEPSGFLEPISVTTSAPAGVMREAEFQTGDERS
jgi:selenide,water dikinase